MGQAKGKSLVIVESPAKARTIAKYLGPDYIVRASMGHVRDLPTRRMGVDLKTFQPTYEVIRGRGKVINELKKLARESKSVYLATDLDREGEAIAWHLKEALGIPDEKVRRVVFNQITRTAIQQSFQNPRSIDEYKVSAQQARRILDRIVGYEISPILWRKVAQGLSAGRVQSVAVRMIVDRERAIEQFVPEEYWKIIGLFATDPNAVAELAETWGKLRAEADKGAPTKGDKLKWLTARGAFEAELVEWAGQRFQAESADQALAVARNLGFELLEQQTEEVADARGPARFRVQLKGRVANPPAYHVRSIERKRTVSKPPAPVITSTLQQTASTRLGFSATLTMRIAQDLYESGYITYMRTDSTDLAPEAVRAVRNYTAGRYGDRYVPEQPNRYASRQKAQEAHEAIRPTEVSLDPDAARSVLDEPAWKLYKLIWERFVACQMAPAEFEVITALVGAETAGGEALWKASGRRVVFDGFMRLAGLSNGEQMLPALAEGQPVHPFAIEPVQNFTQPPPRYTEASLVRALEAEGIGRPSTYATIIQTIQDRGYVEQINRRFYPTLLGRIVTDRLVDRFPQIMDLRFTAQMEDQLDAIQERHLDWVRLLRDFYGPFHKDVQRALAEMEHVGGTPSPYECDKCGKPMLYRIGKGGFLLSCSGYPACKNRQPVDGQGKPLVREETHHRCPNCGRPMVKQTGRFGPFLGCSGYPECKTILNLDREGNVLPRNPPPVTTDLPCPRCGQPLYLRLGKRGPWLGCSAFPHCRGRTAWSSLPEEKQADLLEELNRITRVQSAAADKTEQPAAANNTTAAVQHNGPTNMKCPDCGKPMLIRLGRRGPFLGCSGFPKCRHAEPLPAELQRPEAP